MEEKIKLRLRNQNEVADLTNILSQWIDTFVLETNDGMYRVNAKSIFGVLYFTSDHINDIYLINLSSKGYYPESVNKFRA